MELGDARAGTAAIRTREKAIVCVNMMDVGVLKMCCLISPKKLNEILFVKLSYQSIEHQHQSLLKVRASNRRVGRQFKNYKEKTHLSLLPLLSFDCDSQLKPVCYILWLDAITEC